ncbi:VOC family protein [Gordonia malaquae]|uniref:VOC family protein n=1 Tax=Gordonia malaquae TaxID=410332 RepID=UPI0030175F7A
MSAVAMNLVVVYAEDIERSRGFFEAIGLEFQEERHESGPEHYAATLAGGAVLELYPRGRRTVSRVRLGFTVDDVDETMRGLAARGYTAGGAEAVGRDYGRGVVVVDPDGNRVEIVEGPRPEGDRAKSSAPTHAYPLIYSKVVFPYLEGLRDRFFAEQDVRGGPADREALDLLRRAGAVIEWGDRLSLGEPHKALMIFATNELTRPNRVRWSPPTAAREVIGSGALIPGSGEAVLKHFKLTVNPIGTLPETIWHGVGPEEYSLTAQDGWTPWVDDGLSGEFAPIVVAYADLFCVTDWRANEFADYTLRKLIPGG